MINYMQKVVILVFMVIGNSAMPMEKQLWHNASQPGVCDLIMNASIPTEQNLSVLSNDMQKMCYALRVSAPLITLLATFVKCGIVYRFATGLGGDFDGRRISNVELASWVAVVAIYLSTDCKYVFNDFLERFPWVFIAGATILRLNCVWLKTLEQLRGKGYSWFSCKNKFDIGATEDGKCVLCYDDDTSNEYLNPCMNKDHIFCKGCFLDYLARQHKKPILFKQSDSFWCDWCLKSVAYDSNKFVIAKPTAQRIAWDALKRSIDWSDGVAYFVGFSLMSFLWLI